MSTNRIPVFVPDYGPVSSGHARTLATGDRVRHVRGGMPGTVRDILVKYGHAMYATVDWDSDESGEYNAYELSHAERNRNNGYVD